MTIEPEDAGVTNTISWNSALGTWVYATVGDARIESVTEQNGYVEVVIGRMLENLTVTFSDGIAACYYCS